MAEEDDNVLHLKATYCTERYTYFLRGDLRTPIEVSVRCATTTTGGNLVSDDHDVTGIMVWPATHLLCQHIVAGDLRLGEAVLELGCGCGLVGVAAMKSPQPPSFWTSTDLDKHSLALCQRNLALNDINVEEEGSSSVSVRSLNWGDETRTEELLGELSGRLASDGQRRKFDSIVGADIVYPTMPAETLAHLFLSVDRLLKPDGVFWLSFASRDGPRTPSRLIEAASNAGFLIERLPPLYEAVKRSLPALLDSKLLVLSRSSNAALANKRLGTESCAVFPGLLSALQRLDDPSSEEEWEAPFADD